MFCPVLSRSSSAERGSPSAVGAGTLGSFNVRVERYVEYDIDVDFCQARIARMSREVDVKQA